MAEDMDRLPERPADEVLSDGQKPSKSGGSKPEKKENWFKRTGKRIARWFREMKSELKKVIWPTKRETAKNCAVVAVMVVCSAIVLWGFDQLAYFCVQALISLGA